MGKKRREKGRGNFYRGDRKMVKMKTTHNTNKATMYKNKGGWGVTQPVDGCEVCTFISEQTLGHEILSSFGIISLLTNVPVDLTCHVQRTD